MANKPVITNQSRLHIAKITRHTRARDEVTKKFTDWSASSPLAFVFPATEFDPALSEFDRLVIEVKPIESEITAPASFGVRNDAPFSLRVHRSTGVVSILRPTQSEDIRLEGSQFVEITAQPS